MENVVYVVSDLHMGPGREAATGAWHPLEDFRVDDAFCAFLDKIGSGPAPVELVIAGDFIEYPQILPELAQRSPEDCLGCTEGESCERTALVLGQRPHIASGHPAVFNRLRRFVQDGHSVTIMVGNHDVELLWPRAWSMLADAICPAGVRGKLQRANYSYVVGSASRGRIYIEHGHERDPANRYGLPDAEMFAADSRGTRRIKRNWGTLFVDKVFNQLEPHNWFIDNIKPSARALQLGLRNNIGFTAHALLLVLKFMLTSSPPFGDLIEAKLSDEDELLPEERDPERLAAVVADRDVRLFLEDHLRDEGFRAMFERSVQKLGAVEWRRMRRGAARQPTLDQLSPGPASCAPAAATLGASGEEDAYTTAARQVMERDSRIETVIMGHTHTPVNGSNEPIYLSGNRKGYYYNSGTWTPHLCFQPGVSYTWADLGNSANYDCVQTYLVLAPDERGAYHVQMEPWEA